MRPASSEIGMPLEEVEFQSRDRITLRGWQAMHPSPKARIVLCHGIFGDRTETLWWARRLYPLGYSLLLFDFRARGKSGGARSTLGHLETNDLLGALDFLDGQGTQPTVVLGISMGGAVAIMTAARDDRISAVISHGAYARLDLAIAQRGRLFLGPFWQALAVPMTYFGRPWMQIDPHEVSPMAEAQNIGPRPMLVLHGGKDRVVSPNDAEMIAKAAGPNAQIRVFAHSYHMLLGKADQDAYMECLEAFLGRALSPATEPSVLE